MLREIALNRICSAAYSKRLPAKRWAIPDNHRSPTVRVQIWMDHDKKTIHGDWYVESNNLLLSVNTLFQVYQQI